MRYVFVLAILLGINLSADYVKKTMAVCDEEATILELAQYSEANEAAKDAMQMEMWLTGHNCRIIDRKTEIEVLDYTGKITGIIKIKLKKSGDVVYGRGASVEIEQPGQKNIIKF